MRSKLHINKPSWIPAFKQQCFRSITLVVAFSCVSYSWASTSSVTTGEPEAWVIKTTSPDASIKASADARNGVFYRLFDRQVNTIDTDDRSKYTQMEYEFINRTGVQNRSTITIDFDPNYESIVVHEIGIVRDDVYIDKLANTELQVLRTESDLDELFYNGTKTLTAILEDTRVGDILKYSYTRKGDNPVYDDLIEYTSYTQHNIPMAVASFRLVASKNQALYIRKRDIDETTVITRKLTGDVQQVSWSQRNLVPLKWVDNEPDWNRTMPSFTVSSVKDWKNIVDWALPKYAIAKSDSSELNNVANSIKRRHASTEAQIGSALRWVQNEIRYFGVELGENSHNPSTPDETLTNRFGDCKDKAVLLITLLDKLNIDSQPALVDTDSALRSDNNIYRLHAFDHVIVHVDIKGQSHWIDPTRQNQFGALGEFYEPDYGKALIVDSAQTGLTDMSSDNGEYKLSIIKQLELDSAIDGHALLTLRTNRKGISAENFRYSINNNGLNSLQSDYVDYYRDYYNYLDSDGDLKYSEYPRNSSIMVERYKLAEFWTEYDDGTRGFELVSDETQRYLHSPKAPKYHTKSYALGNPSIIKDVSIIKFNKRIKEEYADETVSNDYFTYKVVVDQDNETDTLTITHSYVSHALSVPPEDIKQYAKDVDRAWEISSIYIPESGLDWSDDETEDYTHNVEQHASNAI